ncbi:hypothetical protein PN836_009775 [Ningiella sp. W23]|uniref:hypothetical protein n=1 Tax=Ningiella sp. W23 TaxID=3023715 RepID=UPI00375646C6
MSAQSFVFTSFSKLARVSLIIFSSLLVLNVASFSVLAQDDFDEFDAEQVTVFVKKIRDEESNYLRDVTIATAKAISKSGEFKAKPFKRNSKGPVIEVQPPAFSYQPHKEGMSAKEMATAGLSLVSDVGGLFGFGEESAKVNEMNARLNQNNAILDAWGDNEQVMVSMQSRVMLIDDDTGVEISRTIKYEKVFDSKETFVNQKEGIIQDAIVGEVKKVLVEYLDDSGF